MAAETRYDPFTCDGVQAVVFYVPGWMGDHRPEVFAYARDARAFVRQQMQYWVHYATRAEIVYYGYDPNVYEPDDGSDDGYAGDWIGTDGYPDAIATIDLDVCEDVDEIPWEQL